MRDLIEQLREAAGVPGRGMGPGQGDPASCPRRKAGLGPLRKRLGRGGPSEQKEPLEQRAPGWLHKKIKGHKSGKKR
jgi:hypothetical protein